jgi:DNA-binding CsgD family transcriptional regulator/sugar-specific transcriptional regulator TrmB
MALRDLGLTDLQERVYRLLLTAPTSSVTDLEAQLKATESDILGALSALVDLSLASVDERYPVQVRLANPKVAVAQLIEKVEDELLRQHRRVADTRADIELLAASPNAHVPPGGIERLENLDLVRERLEELAFYTRASVFSIQTGPLSPASLEASRPLDERGLRRGIDMRIIYDQSVLSNEGNHEYVKRLAAKGAQIRITDEVLERLIVMDSSVAVVPIDPHSSVRGAVIVREPGLVAGFVRLFLAAWDNASEVPLELRPDAGADGQISEEDRQLLELLGQGRTDEAAARQLGVSVRQLRRRVARLMDLLEAGSRFEAGAKAARRGWL